MTHAFPCCRCCAGTLRPSGCWGSRPRRPPRLKAQADCVSFETNATPRPGGPTESRPAAPRARCTACAGAVRTDRQSAGLTHNGLVSSSEWTEGRRWAEQKPGFIQRGHPRGGRPARAGARQCCVGLSEGAAGTSTDSLHQQGLSFYSLPVHFPVESTFAVAISVFSKLFNAATP